MIAVEHISLLVEDITGQVRRRVNRVPTNARVGEFLTDLLDVMHLPANDSQGRSLSYGARAGGAALNEADLIGDVLRHEDTLTLTQNVTAG